MPGPGICKKYLYPRPYMGRDGAAVLAHSVNGVVDDIGNPFQLGRIGKNDRRLTVVILTMVMAAACGLGFGMSTAWSSKG